MTSRRWALTVLAALLALLLVGRWVAAWYVDYLWYASMGEAAARVWGAKAFNGGLLRLSGWLAGALFATANFYAVRRSIAALVLPRRVSNLEFAEEVPGRSLTLAAAALGVLAGALLTFSGDDWTLLAFARYAAASPFGEYDAAYGNDLSFWVAWLPLERALYGWALKALLAVAAIVLLLYAVTGSLRWEGRALRVTRHVRRHVTVLGALVIALLGWSYRLDGFDALITGSGPDLAATWVDHAVLVPTSRALFFICLLGAALVAWAGWNGHNRVSFVAVTVVLVASILLRQILPPLAQRVAAPRDRSVQERKYLTTRALYTVRAYGIDRVRTAGTDSAAPRLGAPSSASASSGVPLWEPALLARAVAAARARGAGAVSPAFGWEAAPSGLLAYGVERPSDEVDAGVRAPWAIVRVLASSADAEGWPVLLDPPGASSVGDGAMPPPLVYDSARGYAIVPDTFQRVPGANVESTRARLAHAWSEQNLRLLFADLPRHNPRIVLRRDVRERVRALAPFFAQGRTVSPLVAADTLYWVVDLYSASASYPLSMHQVVGGEAWTYFQHAATALVHAHTGRVTLVADVATDRAARVWMERFPGLFTEAAALPERVAALIPPPADGALAQARALARYGLRTERWAARHLPSSDGADTAASRGGPAPVAVDVPGAGRVTAWTTALLDDTQHVRGVYLASGGPSQPAWWLPLGEPRVAWTAVLDQFQRAPDGAALGPRNVRPVFGRLRVVPTQAAVLYAQPVYAYRDGAPSLLRVAVTAGRPGDSARVGRTFAAAVGAAPTAPDSLALPATAAQFRARVEQLYDAMRGALRRSDWGAFGRAYDELGTLLGRAPERGRTSAPSAARDSAARAIPQP